MTRGIVYAVMGRRGGRSGVCASVYAVMGRSMNKRGTRGFICGYGT